MPCPIGGNEDPESGTPTVATSLNFFDFRRKITRTHRGMRVALRSRPYSMNHFRYAFRVLIKSPGFTAVAVLTLALGIGANTAIFSFVNAVLLRPLPFQEPARLIWIANIYEGGLSGVTSTVFNFLDWKKMNQSCSDLAAYFAFSDYSGYILSGKGDPEHTSGMGISQKFLEVLGVHPALGRSFDAEESKWNGRKAVILTHGFWQRRFASDPNIVGQAITLNGQPTVVVGVMPETFDFPGVFTPGSKVDMLTPFPLAPETQRWGNTLAVVGRLKPRVTATAAQAEFNVINDQLRKSHPERGTDFGAKITLLQDHVRGNFRQSLVLLFCAVGFVLLMACANLSNLLLARASSRRKEIAVRIALGATRRQLITQMLTESVLLSFAGAAVGLPLAFFATHTLASSKAFSVPLLATTEVDSTALLFTLIVAISTGLLFGLVPAIQSSATDVHESLKDSGRGSTGGRRKTWVRETLVVSQVALACILLVGAGLIVRSFLRLLDVDLGFRPTQAVTWRVEPGRGFDSQDQFVRYYDNLVERIQTIPGVESVGITDTLPLGRNRSWGVGAKGVSYPPGQYPDAFPRLVDYRYLETMKVPLRAGRYFTAGDTAKSPLVVVVNEALAKRLWPGKQALGQVLVGGGGKDYEVVGVVSNVRHSGVDEESGPEMYYLITQLSDVGAIDMVVRSKLPVAALIPQVRAALREVDSHLPTSDYRTLGQIVDQAISPKRLITMLLGGFATLALVLAALGIYGVISYSVSQRTHEMGIRMAVGASSASVIKLVIGEGMKMAGVGVGVGLIGALLLTRLMQGLLFGIDAADPVTFATNAVVLTAVTLLACWLPARRAAKVDPMVALRDS